MQSRELKALLIGTLCMLTWALSAQAQQAKNEAPLPGWWVSAGLGSAGFGTDAFAPATGRQGAAATFDLGYRFTPSWAFGLEFGAVMPSGGCASWECAGSVEHFSPDFTRVHAFTEYRPRQTGWRLQAGVGVSRFCYSSHWSDSAWSWADTLDSLLLMINGDSLQGTVGGSGGNRCDARRSAVGGMVALGYDWRLATEAPLSFGVRLSGEAARFSETPQIGLPAFRHRAVMLTLHLNLN